MSCQEARVHIDFLIEFFMDLSSFERQRYKNALWFYERHKNFQQASPKQFQECVKELGKSIEMVHEKYNFKHIHAEMKHELPPIPEEDTAPKKKINKVKRRNAVFFMST
jgi:uncharacterized membrane protein